MKNNAIIIAIITGAVLTTLLVAYPRQEAGQVYADEMMETADANTFVEATLDTGGFIYTASISISAPLEDSELIRLAGNLAGTPTYICYSAGPVLEHLAPAYPDIVAVLQEGCFIIIENATSMGGMIVQGVVLNWNSRSLVMFDAARVYRDLLDDTTFNVYHF